MTTYFQFLGWHGCVPTSPAISRSVRPDGRTRLAEELNMCRDHLGAPEGFQHQPVLCAEVASLFSTGSGLLVDATFGGGGHSKAIFEQNPNLSVLGLDRDRSAVLAGETVSLPLDRFMLRLSEFADIAQAVHDARDAGFVGAETPVIGVLADLGVSSPQIDTPERGFSYQRSGPLDMRMGSTGRTARELIDELDAGELADILWRFGDEKFSRRIARSIKDAGSIQTTGQLADIVEGAVPGAARKRRGHPAARTFQALRIAVNDELGQLEALLDAAWETLAVGGRFAVISYHSLEDRLVKRAFRSWTQTAGTGRGPERLLPNQTSMPPAKSLGTWSPGPDELTVNPRSRSARLRAIERQCEESSNE
ncbi:MAG: 16S rRNA (cytosine(1402)-N(4))-methyltransferase RsmH [Acidimicrobiia bacterium]|nr:16S rRNA (cytosine(1402)-N(4))-methyltransferase RsmH [Acidimicrobiia bacterium]